MSKYLYVYGWRAGSGLFEACSKLKEANVERCKVSYSTVGTAGVDATWMQPIF